MPTSLFRDEAVLVSACLDGDQRAWDEFVERYARLVHSITRRNGFHGKDAEDIFQTVFLIAFRQLSSVKNPAALSGWLATIAHNECHHTSSRSHEDAELSEFLETGKPELAEHIILREREKAVHEALSRLDPRCRQLLLYLFSDDNELTYEIIAEKLDIPRGSIGPNRLRCLQKLEKILKRMGYDH